MRRLYLLVLVMWLAACSPAPTPPPPTPTPTPVATSTPLPPITTDAFATIPQSISAEGYPVLGYANAPLTLVGYNSYDSRASLNAHNEVILPLLPRIENGDIRYIYVPLSGTGSAQNGVGAARAALCAAEQNAFWAYHERLFALFGTQGETAYTDENLQGIAQALTLDSAEWTRCILSERPTAILDTAAADALRQESYNGTPTLLLNGSYVLNDVFSLNNIAEQMLARIASGETVDGSITLENEPTPETVFLPSTANQSLGVPIDIALPDGWTLALNDAFLVTDIDAVRTVPFLLYRGAVSGGTGTILVLWGFPNITSGNLMEVQMGIATPVPNLRTDGLRLLRLAVIEQGCNIGTDVERVYRIGEFEGSGAQWSAVDCPELPDTRGWFVGTQQNGINFLFYVYLEPIDPSGVTETERIAREELQAILNTVTFRPLDDFATQD